MSMQFDHSMFNHQTANCGGFNYHYVDEGSREANATTILLIHGFPDLWYGWRYQIKYLASLGTYRVIVPDMLGYGGTDKPRVGNDVEARHHPAYSTRTVASHIVQLLDHLQVEKAVLVGHDWGTGIVSRVGWYFPERLLAAIAIGNPFRPVTNQMVTIEDYVKENPAFQYMEYFVRPEAASDMDAMVEDVVNEIFPNESGNSDKDRAYYTQNLRSGGFEGPLSYYKSLETCHQEELYLVGKRFTVPALLLIVTSDPILSKEYCQQLPTDYFDNIEIDEIDTGEHWVLTQNPDAVNSKLESYLKKFLGQDTTTTNTNNEGGVSRDSSLAGASSIGKGPSHRGQRGCQSKL